MPYLRVRIATENPSKHAAQEVATVLTQLAVSDLANPPVPQQSTYNSLTQLTGSSGPSSLQPTNPVLSLKSTSPLQPTPVMPRPSSFATSLPPWRPSSPT